MEDKQDVFVLNALIKEADELYGTKISKVSPISRACYKLGLLEAYNDDHKELHASTMDIQVWLNGEYNEDDRKSGYQRYCEYIKHEPKYKKENEEKYGSDFREKAWKEYVKNRQDDADAKEAAKIERRKKREAKKQKNL